MTKRLLADAVDIRRWLAADAESPYAVRLARDREIGRRLHAAEGSLAELSRILAWWTEVQTPAAAGDQAGVGERMLHLVRLARVLLVAGGMLLGLGVGAVAFAYDGSHPVNLLALLGVVVGIPLGLLLLTGVFLLPGRLPGLAALKDAIAVLNPGRWVGAWLDRYAGLTLYAGLTAGRSSFARWQLVEFSQWLAVGYFAGVLLSGWLLVVVTDLAFGWSTTLSIGAGQVHGLFSLVAAPWAGWLPAAAPDPALVEASRYFRLETSAVGLDRAIQLGRWWPFVLMTILVWGLLPRLLLLLLGRWRLIAATRAMLCEDPEVLALLDRLTPPRVDFGAMDDGQADQADGMVPPPPALAADARTGVLLWNGALPESTARDWLVRSLDTDTSRITALGAGDSEDARRQVLEELGRDLDRLLVVTKGWEPPLLEFADLLEMIRQVVGAHATIVVVPLNTTRTGVDEADRAVWAGFLARRGDPRLYALQGLAGAGGDARPTGEDAP